MITNYGLQVLKEVEKFEKVSKWYNEMTGCVLVPERILEVDNGLLNEIVKFLKTAKPTEEKPFEKWALEYVQGYDEENPKLNNESWFVSLRLVDEWC